MLDVNDNVPVFNQLRYQATVLEGSPRNPNHVVLTVSASDIDTPQDQIAYSLDSVGQQYFTIGRKTGDIQIGGTPLDREKTPVLNFTVLASDGKHTGKAGIKVWYGRPKLCPLFYISANGNSPLPIPWCKAQLYLVRSPYLA